MYGWYEATVDDLRAFALGCLVKANDHASDREPVRAAAYRGIWHVFGSPLPKPPAEHSTEALLRSAYATQETRAAQIRHDLPPYREEVSRRLRWSCLRAWVSRRPRREEPRHQQDRDHREP